MDVVLPVIMVQAVEEVHDSFAGGVAGQWPSHLSIIAAATSSNPFSASGPAMWVAITTEEFHSGSSHKKGMKETLTGAPFPLNEWRPMERSL